MGPNPVSSALLAGADTPIEPSRAVSAQRYDTADRYPLLLPCLLLGSIIFWTVAWYWDTALSMAHIWWRSETFAHGMVVYPISLWLIWRERDRLRGLIAVPAYWVLVALAGTSFGWLLGELGGVQAARHFALATMLIFTTWVVLGTGITRAIAFPLGFTLLAVPIGEFLLPVLTEHTADFTVGALRLSGIPVYREGNNFVVPTGSWSVVEACSGLRYLIASATLGLLYAYLSYTSLLKRSLFVLASVLVPIVANWLRAYMIVMIGHLSSMKYAVGVDHLIYGWIFFGLVMLLLFWVGSFWREDTETRVEQSRPDSPTARASSPLGVLVAGVLAAAVVTLGPSYSGRLESTESGFFVRIDAPNAVKGWRIIEGQAAYLRPHFVGARSTFESLYERDGRELGLYIAYYADQREGAELISSQNVLVTERDRMWRQMDERTISIPGIAAGTSQTRLRSHDREITAWQWYWIEGQWLTDPRHVKLRQALNKLMGKGDDAAAVVFYTRSDGPPAEAARVLQAFSEDMHASIGEALGKVRTEQLAIRQSRAPNAR